MKQSQAKHNIECIGFILLYLAIFVGNNKFVDFIFQMDKIVHMEGALGTFFSVYVKYLMLTVIPVVIYAVIFKIRGQNLWRFCKFNFMDRKTFLLSIGVGVSISISILFFMKIPLVEQKMPALENFFSGFDQGNIFYYLLFSFVLYTLLEEIIFRGLIYNELIQIVSIPVAVIIQALLFIFMHSDLVSFLVGVVSYTIYCVVYIWTNSIWGSFFVLYASHTFILLVRRTGIANAMGDLPTTASIIGSCIGSILTIFLFYVLYANYQGYQRASRRNLVVIKKSAGRI